MKFKTGLSLLALATALAACGGGNSNSGDGTTAPTNTAPVIDAGSAQSAVEGATVQLAATATDADNDTLSYSWSQTSGPSVTLSSTTVQNPSFTAPDVTENSDIVLSLSVSDGTTSVSDTVTITITDTTTTSSTSGKDQVVAPGLTVTLSAGAEAGDTVAWTQTGGTNVALSDASANNPSFTAPNVTQAETLDFQVTVNGTTNTVSTYIYVPADYTASTGLTQVANFTDKTEWACNLSAGTASATLSDSGTFKTISGNGIPDHAVGTFPNPGNPNTISDQNISFEIPGAPEKTTTATDMQTFGVFLNGVKLERDTAERYSGSGGGSWSYEAITPGLELGNSKGDDTQRSVSENWLGSDCNNSHVQPTGQYHSHGLPEAYIQALLKDTPDDMVLAGYAADGFPIYLRFGYTDAANASSGLKVIEHSWELKSGTRPNGPGGAYDGTFREDWEYSAGSGDTDQCGGRTGPTPEFPDGTYHYYVTDDYPYIPRCVFGTPSSSFRSRGGG